MHFKDEFFYQLEVAENGAKFFCVDIESKDVFVDAGCAIKKLLREKKIAWSQSVLVLLCTRVRASECVCVG